GGDGRRVPRRRHRAEDPPEAPGRDVRRGVRRQGSLRGSAARDPRPRRARPGDGTLRRGPLRRRARLVSVPLRRHPDVHVPGAEAVRDLILGMSDGLTTPFALAAGLAGAASSNILVVIGGLAEIAAGSISMGLGGYLAAKSLADTYH